MRDEEGVLPRLVERIRYSVYGEPTVFPYSFADCADTSSGEGPDGYITTHDQTQFNAWYGATPKDIRADVADDGSVVPMDLGFNTGVFGSGGLGDQDAFNGEYGANGGLYPVEGAASLVPGFWSSGGAAGATGSTDSPVSDNGYCGYAWNKGAIMRFLKEFGDRIRRELDPRGNPIDTSVPLPEGVTQPPRPTPPTPPTPATVPPAPSTPPQ